MLLNSAIEGGTGNAQLAGSMRNIAGMFHQHFLHHHPLKALESVVVVVVVGSNRYGML